MSPLGFEPRTPASLRTYLKETNSYELGSYKSSALARLSYGLINLISNINIYKFVSFLGYMKTPKVVKGKNIVKVLIKNGYEVKSRKGSHVSLSNGKIHITVVLPLTTI